MNNENDFLIGKFFWQLMPLDEREMRTIPESHRIRPYYIFAKNENDEYYGFACTSHEPKEINFSNNSLQTSVTTIGLSECYKFSKDILIKGRMCNHIPKLSLSQMDELMKKLKNNYNFNNYPIDVKNRINDYMDNCEYSNKDILYNIKTKQLIIVIAKTTRYLCINLSYIPTAGYAEMMLDGYKCYLDVLNPFYLDNIDDFILSNISSVYEDVFKQKEDDIVYIKDTLDVSNHVNLPIGSVISVLFNKKLYIFVKIGQSEKGIEYLIREKNGKGKKYIMKTIPCKFNFKYNFMHILGEKKLSYTKTKIKK